MNKLRTTLIVILVILALQAQAAVAQNRKIEGVVTDQNGAPVSGAEVTLAAKSTTVTRTTNGDGQFTFDLPGEAATLTVRAQGFATAERVWNSSDPDAANFSITLAAAPLSEQMVVTASRTETRVSETAASVVMLSREVLSATAAVTLDDALRQVPGFSLFRRSGSRTANPTTQGVSLRGVGASGASRAVVLSDRIPLNDPFGGWVYWGRVPRESIGRVEVVQGGASSLYGTDALGGVVNFIPRDTSQSALSFEASYGNQQTPDVSLYAGGRKNAWGAQLSAETFHTDGYILVDEDQRGIVDTKAGSERSAVELTLDRSFEDRSGRVFARGSIFGESRENGTPLQTNRTHIRQLAIGGDWLSELAGTVSARVYVGAQVYDQDFSAIAADRNSEALTRSQRVPAQQTGFSFQWSRPAGSFQTLTAGVDWREVRGASDELVFIAGNLTSAIGVGGRERAFGAFAQDIIRITPRWLLTVGVRGDRWRNYNALSTTRPLAQPGPGSVTQFADRDETAFSPRVSLLHRLTENVSLFASGTRAFRAPTLNELYRSFRVGNVLTLANVDLQAERLTGAEAGANITALNNRLNVRGVFFWANVTRTVANVTLEVTPALITRQRQNLSRTQSPGIEIEADARISNALNLSAGYQFVNATVVSFPANASLEGLLIPQVPRHQFTFQARYSNPRVLTFGLQGRASSEQFDDDQNLLPLAAYFTLDAIVSRRLGSAIEVFGALENLTGQRYEVGRTPVTTLGPSFLARVGLRVSLGKR